MSRNEPGSIVGSGLLSGQLKKSLAEDDGARKSS
jgi:hypothetical protein